MSDVVVVDLGMGNLRSVASALGRAGARVTIASDPEVIARAPRLVVPGQGHFADGARAIASERGEALRAHVASGRPYLGLCLGMQLLFESSEEAPGLAGLGLFAGKVVRFEAGRDEVPGVPRKVPHMGWNEVLAPVHPLFEPRAWFYFVHSFHCVPREASVVAGTSEYGETFCAAVARDHVVACQFHPEKSHRAGARLLERFVAWAP